MDINAIIKLNGTEITEQSRKLASNFRTDNSDFELASGASRRYLRPTYPIFDLTWSYIPNISSMALDARAARDFLWSLTTTGSLISMDIQSDGYQMWRSYSCLITNYNEDLLRNDLTNKCRYYSLTMQLTAVS